MADDGDRFPSPPGRYSFEAELLALVCVHKGLNADWRPMLAALKAEHDAMARLIETSERLCSQAAQSSGTDKDTSE